MNFAMSKISLAVILILFTFIQLPKIGLTPARENVFERQSQTAGMVRLYCLDGSRHPLASPQLPWGTGAFNMELSIFEWAQGAVSRLVDGGSCQSVELVTQITALIAAVVTLVLAFLLGNALFGPFAAVLCAGALAFDSAWLKFSTYMLMDIRSVAFAFLGGYLCLKRRWTWATLAWFVSASHRPQAFTATGTFFIILLGIVLWMRERRFSLKSTLAAAVPVVLGGALGLCYHVYAAVFNRSHDLPWFTWAGPRIFNTYFGNWHERWEAAYWKGLFFDGLHKTALNLALASIFSIGLLLFLGARKDASRAQHVRFIQNLLKKVLILTLPYIVGRFIYTFLFLTVFKWHDYYAVPLNGLGALTKGLILGFILKQTAEYLRGSRTRLRALSIATAVTVVPLLVWGASNAVRDARFTAERRDPTSSLYYHDWGQTIFPATDTRSLVVVVHPRAARDMGYLYISKHPGFTWCNHSPENAPRAFWQQQGVKYVAWPEDGAPGQPLRWKVRTMAEELAHARAQGWSSEVKDYWAGRTMAEWAKIASRHDLNPCQGDIHQRDPRLWKD